MKQKILGILALLMCVSTPAFALPLTLFQEPAHIVGPQSTSNPCVIAGTQCSQPAGFTFTNFVQSGAIPDYNETSPIYTVSQITGLLGSNTFNIAIDVNTASHLEKLDLFEVIIGGVVVYTYNAGAIIGANDSNGNGYADWTLRNVDLSSFAGATSVQFHTIFSGADDGPESFFLIAGTPNNPCTANCFPEVPEPSALILMGAGLAFIPVVTRRLFRSKKLEE
jgi:hypothetical protein